MCDIKQQWQLLQVLPDASSINLTNSLCQAVCAFEMEKCGFFFSLVLYLQAILIFILLYMSYMT